MSHPANDQLIDLQRDRDAELLDDATSSDNSECCDAKIIGGRCAKCMETV